MKLTTDTKPDARTSSSCFYDHVDPLKIKGCVNYKYKFFPTTQSKQGTLHMTVGIPGSGKSTIVEKLSHHLQFHNIDHEVIQLDEIRSVNRGASEEEIIESAKYHVDQCIASGKHCIYDATNITNQNRKYFLESTLRNGGEIFVSVLNTHPEIASYRDARRSNKSIGRRIINDLYEGLKSSEGVSAVWKEREEGRKHHYNYNVGVIDVKMSKNECKKVGVYDPLTKSCELTRSFQVPVSKYKDNRNKWEI